MSVHTRTQYCAGGEGIVAHTVIFGHWLPRLLGAQATTIGSRIYVRGRRLSPWLHAHEYGHTSQARRYGVTWFLIRYTAEMAFRIVQAPFTGPIRTTLSRAHDRHSLEQKADAFGHLQSHRFRWMEWKR
jgi:hypothetical protein